MKRKHGKKYGKKIAPTEECMRDNKRTRIPGSLWLAALLSVFLVPGCAAQSSGKPDPKLVLCKISFSISSIAKKGREVHPSVKSYVESQEFSRLKDGVGKDALAMLFQKATDMLALGPGSNRRPLLAQAIKPMLSACIAYQHDKCRGISAGGDIPLDILDFVYSSLVSCGEKYFATANRK